MTKEPPKFLIRILALAGDNILFYGSLLLARLWIECVTGVNI